MRKNTGGLPCYTCLSSIQTPNKNSLCLFVPWTLLVHSWSENSPPQCPKKEEVGDARRKDSRFGCPPCCRRVKVQYHAFRSQAILVGFVRVCMRWYHPIQKRLKIRCQSHWREALHDTLSIWYNYMIYDRSRIFLESSILYIAPFTFINMLNLSDQDWHVLLVAMGHFLISSPVF